MEKISIKDDPKLEEYFEIAKKAKTIRDESKNLLDEADEIEKEAIKKFREFYEKKREALITVEENLKSELNASEEELPKLISIFCKQKGHTFSYRTVRTGLHEIGHTFAGSIYPTATYKTCIICGWSNDKGSITEQMAERMARERRREILSRAGVRYGEADTKPKHYNPNYKPDEVINLIKQALLSENESDETTEWKKTAQRIVDLTEEIKKQKAELIQIQSQKEELCSLFGHDAELVDATSEDFKCKCCGKKMGYRSYINAHYNAPYRGGIIEFMYSDDNPIVL